MLQRVEKCKRARGDLQLDVKDIFSSVLAWPAWLTMPDWKITGYPKSGRLTG